MSDYMDLGLAFVRMARIEHDPQMANDIDDKSTKFADSTTTMKALSSEPERPDSDEYVDPFDNDIHGYVARGQELGRLVADKQDQYGNAVEASQKMMDILYPRGVPKHAHADALLLVRVCDKMCRIATRGADGKDRGGESPWKDIAGYGLLGWSKDEK